MDFERIEREIATPDSPWTVSTASGELTFVRKGNQIQIDQDGTVTLFRQREDGEYHFVVIDDETREALLKIWKS